MRRMLALTIVAVALFVVPSSQSWAADEISGSVLKLASSTKDSTINVGGLVVVVIPDSGSRPPKDIKVDFPRACKKLGVVQGAQTEEGIFVPGGGYTWYLLTPVNTGETTITVTYTRSRSKSPSRATAML
jgi:hypothetical protein